MSKTKKTKRSKDRSGNFPPIEDEVWAAWSEPIIAYLDKPKPVKFLFQWARSNKISGDTLRNLLAWLSLSDIACAFRFQSKKTGKFIVAWKLLPPKKKIPIIDLSEHETIEFGCPVCGGTILQEKEYWTCISCHRPVSAS